MNEIKNDAADNPLQSEQKTKRERSSLCKVLPTDRIAFDKQVKVLQAFAAVYESNGGKPVTCDQAGGTLTPTFSASTLNVAVPFFTDISLLTRNEGGFVPCPELLAYNQAVRLSATEAKRKLRPVFEKTWFYQLLAPRVQLNAKTIQECVGILAVEAKAGEEHIKRVEPLINFLELAGIVAISGGMVSFVANGVEAPAPESIKLPPGVPAVFTDQEEHSLYLDKEKTRKVTINSPLFISKAEYKRICNWIKVALIVEGIEEEDKTP
jgi:hypothetical protein